MGLADRAAFGLLFGLARGGGGRIRGPWFPLGFPGVSLGETAGGRNCAGGPLPEEVGVGRLEQGFEGIGAFDKDMLEGAPRPNLVLRVTGVVSC